MNSRYRVLVATGVGTGGWTSKIAADRARDKLAERGFKNVETRLCRVDQVRELVDSWKPDFVVTIIGKEQDLGLPSNVPVFSGVALVSGFGLEPILDQMADILRKPHWSGMERP